MIIENKKENTDSPRAIRDKLGVGSLSTITIQDMLKGVNDNGVAITDPLSSNRKGTLQSVGTLVLIRYLFYFL